MDQLPSSIEAYLEEAGFSGTEILVLRRLMDGEPLTIRQLGAKTGKSTGVLDQAMKKLLKKRIVKREIINDTPKYMLDSMQSVVEWMEDDMQQKREVLLRRHQNFESFVTTLESGSKRPDIEYFEGDTGITQAYTKLLNGPGEILHYFPVTVKEEEDTLHDFRVQYFRERQRRKMFSRVITHDTPLGRRFQSRDIFEYRKTVLVSEKEYPFTFEKIIAGDRIACIDHNAKTACVIRYPELTDIERTLFEAIWRQAQLQAINGNIVQPLVTKEEPKKEGIALTTESFSKLRQFFLSPKSLVALGLCALLSSAVTFMLYQQNLSLNKQRIQERVKSIAATAALQFRAADVEAIRTAEDIQKPEYSKLIYDLNRIRRENEGVKYAYIMRPTGEPGVHQFVADADALDPFTQRDVNGNGIIDPADHLSPPGEIYEEDKNSNGDWFVFDQPAAYDFGTDRWGTFLTGSAPIRNAEGEPVAIIGVDVEADQLYDLANASFWPIASFVGFFLLFLFLRFVAFNPVFAKESTDLFRGRRVVVLLTIGVIIVLLSSLGLYAQSIQRRIDSVRSRILTIATTGVLQFSAEELEVFRTLQDAKRPEHERVVQKLHDIREQNENIQYAYLIRPRADSTTFEFIADADALGIDLREGADTNRDTEINDADEIGYPGLSYDVSHIEILRERSYFMPTVTKMPYTDKWGTFFTGYAPVRNKSEAVVALLAIDMSADGLYVPDIEVFYPILAFALLLVSFVLWKRPEIVQSWIAFIRHIISRKKLYGAVFIAMGIYWTLFGLHFYTLRLKQEEIGRRLMAIAATAALQIDAKDLEEIRFARDMKTEEYQRIFNQLTEVRNNNPDITYVYILRPTEQEGIWEFIADTDSNYYIPFDETDYNYDGTVDDADENVAPGVAIYWPEILAKNKWQQPYYEFDMLSQWGEVITGSAPIHDIKGNPIGLLGIDMRI